MCLIEKIFLRLFPSMPELGCQLTLINFLISSAPNNLKFPYSATVFLLQKHELLTHWGRVTHICISDLTIIGSDNGLSPSRRQAIIRTNTGILLKRPLGTSFSEILIEILLFSFKKMRLKVSSAKMLPFCLGLNVLNHCGPMMPHCNTKLGQHWLR